MADKKFSDFTSIISLQDNEFLATELLGVENRKITFNDFAKQIQDRFLKLSFSDIGCIKSSLISPSDNKQPNMIYCDGTTYYASNPNTLISKFINAIYPYEALRNFLEIPADKSSFKTPDLRNQHLVGVGSGNVAYQYITSKVMNFITGVSTTTTVGTNITINSGGDHYHIVNSWEENQDGGTSGGNYGGRGYYRNKAYTNPYRTQNSGAHIHTGSATSTATSTTALSYNNTIIDNINRVPALAVYHYIDIAVDRFNLDPNATGGGVLINISDVIGLQDALDSKVDTTTLVDYATISALNTGLSGKAELNHTHPIDNVVGLDIALNGKANAIHTHLIGDLKYDTITPLESWLDLTYAPIGHTHNIYLNKNGSVLLDNTYIPSDDLSIATKGYVDGLIPTGNYLELGVEYNTDNNGLGIAFRDNIEQSVTEIKGTGISVGNTKITKNSFEVVFGTDTAQVLADRLIFKGGNSSYNRLDIDSLQGTIAYKELSTSNPSILDLKNRQLNDNILTANLVDNSIILKKDIIKPALVSIPVLATTIANGAIVNLNLGAPVLLVGEGVVDDYVSVINNLVKTKNTTNRVISFGAGILANYSATNSNRNYRFMARRPAVVSVAGTNPNDVLNDDIDVKLGTGSIADCEFNFADTYTNGATDPFNVDGFVFSIDNISGLDISTILTRVGYAKQSYIRISFK